MWWWLMKGLNGVVACLQVTIPCKGWDPLLVISSRGNKPIETSLYSLGSASYSLRSLSVHLCLDLRFGCQLSDWFPLRLELVWVGLYCPMWWLMLTYWSASQCPCQVWIFHLWPHTDLLLGDLPQGTSGYCLLSDTTSTHLGFETCSLSLKAFSLMYKGSVVCLNHVKTFCLVSSHSHTAVSLRFFPLKLLGWTDCFLVNKVMLTLSFSQHNYVYPYICDVFPLQS